MKWAQEKRFGVLVAVSEKMREAWQTAWVTVIHMASAKLYSRDSKEESALLGHACEYEEP